MARTKLSSQESIDNRSIKNFWCPHCKSKEIIKWGYRKNKEAVKQKFKCKKCNKFFVIDDGFYHIHKRKELVTSCLDLYFGGLSLRKIRHHINQFTQEGVSHMTIWRWIIRYSKMIKKFTDSLEPQLSRIFHVDEIYVNCKGNTNYFWDIVDKGTRFLVSTHYSTKRDSKSAKLLFLKTKHRPLTLFSDGLQGYRKAVKKVYGTNFKKDRIEYIRLKADRDKRNNIIERIQRTIRERVKVMRAFKRTFSAEAILNLFVIYYNYIKVHQGIKTTPAEMAGINLNLKQNKWLSLIELSC